MSSILEANMLLRYRSEKIELARDESGLKTIFEKINDVMDQEDTVFSHLVIDGVEVYDNHEEYIKDKINEIMQIEIITKSTKEMIWETMESLHQYLQRAIPALQNLVDKCFVDFYEEVWEGIGQLIEGMQWMFRFKTFIEQSAHQPLNLEKFINVFQILEEQFAELSEAVESQNTVLITELLAHKIVPSYETLQESVAKMLQNRNYLNHLN